MKDDNMEDGNGHLRDHKDASAAKHDDHDMRRMGKTPELRRVFRQVSIMSLTCVIMATWEYLFTANSRGLLNGGPGGMIWYVNEGYSPISRSSADSILVSQRQGEHYGR
jgi:choline transport protein